MPHFHDQNPQIVSHLTEDTSGRDSKPVSSSKRRKRSRFDNMGVFCDCAIRCDPRAYQFRFFLSSCLETRIVEGAIGNIRDGPGKKESGSEGDIYFYDAPGAIALG